MLQYFAPETLIPAKHPQVTPLVSDKHFPVDVSFMVYGHPPLHGFWAQSAARAPHTFRMNLPRRM